MSEEIIHKNDLNLNYGTSRPTIVIFYTTNVYLLIKKRFKKSGLNGLLFFLNQQLSNNQTISTKHQHFTIDIPN